MLEQLGWGLSDIVGKPILNFIHPDGRELAVRNLVKLADGTHDRLSASDIAHRTRTNGSVLFSSQTSAMTNPQSGEKYFVTVLRDVGTERALEKQLGLAVERAESASRMKSEFLANMSHEIRTPLNGVVGMAQVLARSKLDINQTEQLNTIIESSNSLMSLLNDILDLSKIEAGQLDISPITCDVRHKLGRVHKLFEPIAAEKQIAFQFFVDPSVPAALEMDPVRVRQCLSNLLSNAMKFTEKGSVTTMITAERRSDNHHLVKIFVSDTGIGIPADKQDQIFADFQQADGSTNRKFGGTGLGLSVTKSLAGMMGGEISVTSQPGKGSVFILSFLAAEAGQNVNYNLEDVHVLPVQPKQDTGPVQPISGEHKAPHPSVPDEPNVADSYPAPTPVRLSGKNILVVDDNMINRRVMCAMLSDHNVLLQEAENGLKALSAMENIDFDIVLLDIQMPVLDGIETFKAMQADKRLKDIPVIALTANAMSTDRDTYMQLGMDGYIPKPINYDDIISELHRVFNTANTQRRAG